MPFSVTQTPKDHRMAKCRHPAPYGRHCRRETYRIGQEGGYDKIEEIVSEAPTNEKRKGKQPSKTAHPGWLDGVPWYWYQDKVRSALWAPERGLSTDTPSAGTWS